jgi:hypothetical protein
VNEEPLISRGVLTAVVILFVAAALGGGAYVLTQGDVSLPDLGEPPGQVTELQDIAEPGPPVPGDPFSSAVFGSAIQKVRDAVGPGAELTRLFINQTQTQFIVRRGNDIEAYGVRPDSGDLMHADASITVAGDVRLADFAFPLDGVEASAVDRMLAAARRQSGAPDFRPTVLSLERPLAFGERKLEWTINAEGSGRNLLYRARADGSEVRNEGGRGMQIPEATLEARKLNECIREAGSDSDAVFACFDEFQP